MKISPPHCRRFLCCALASGLIGTCLAAPPLAPSVNRERPSKEDSKVYIIVEEPARPGTPPQVIEVIPVAPPAEVKRSPQTRTRSSSKEPRRGETQYLVVPEEPAPTVVMPPSRNPSSSTKKTETTTIEKKQGTSKQEVSSSKKPTTSSPKVTRTSKSTSSSSGKAKAQADSTAVEVQRLQDRVEKLQTEIDVAKKTAPPPSKKETVVEKGEFPVTPLPTSATEERLPVVTEPAPAPAPAPVVSQTTVTEKVTKERVSDGNPPPAPPSKVDPLPPTGNGDPLNTAPPPEPSSTTVTVTKDESKSKAPVATKTDTPGLVKSPYPPHKTIDVRGMAPGTLAKDPTTEEVFRVP